MNDRYLPVDPEPYLDWWQTQFEPPPDTLSGCSFWQRGKNSIWVAAGGVDPGQLAPVDGVGIPFVRIGREVWKPTWVAAVEFGATAARNVVELDRDEAARFLQRQTLDFSDDPRGELPCRGYVIARLRGLPLGCGLWRQATLVSSVPKGRATADLELP